MCRNIRILYNFDPPATDEEIRAAATQFVRKVTGFTSPSKVNQQPCEIAIAGISDVVERLFSELQTSAPAKDRNVEEEKARERSKQRFQQQK